MRGTNNPTRHALELVYSRQILMWFQDIYPLKFDLFVFARSRNHASEAQKEKRLLMQPPAPGPCSPFEVLPFSAGI